MTLDTCRRLTPQLHERPIKWRRLHHIERNLLDLKKSFFPLVALAATGTVFAQSSVTLSGIIKGGVAVTEYTHGPVGTKTNGTGWGVQDGSSRFIISGVEDLGGGLKALFQIDTRFRVDDNGSAPTSGLVANGNTFVGLGGAFGTVSIGKRDTHWCLGTDKHGNLATPLQASSCALLGYVNVGGTGAPDSTQAIANTARTTNVVRYDTPDFAGFSGSISVSPSFNYNGSEGPVGDAGKGNAHNIAVNYNKGPLTVAGSFWNAESENRSTGAAKSDQRAYTLTAGYLFGPFGVGLTWDRSKFTTGLVNVSSVDSRRDVWSIPLTLQFGNGMLLATYTQARDVHVGSTRAPESGAKLYSVGYNYTLSKRTSLGISYTYLNNDRNAAYRMFALTSLGGFAPALAGQDQKQLYVGIRHAF